MSDAFELQPSIPQAHPPPIRWRSWPLRDDARRASLVVIGLLIAAAVVGWLSRRPYLALLALVALATALWRFFLPVVFQLSEEGVDQWLFGRQRRIRWQAIRRYEVCSAGLLLLPHEDRSVMAPFRGLYLPWSTHRDEVLAHVHYYLDQPDQT